MSALAIIEQHKALGQTGVIRLRLIERGLQMEISIPGMRLTRKAPKCSTILRREFGLQGKPESLLQQFKALLAQAEVVS